MKLSLKNWLVAAVAVVIATFGAASAGYAEAAKYRVAYIARAQGDSFGMDGELHPVQRIQNNIFG
jgi:hypothetical protein